MDPIGAELNLRLRTKPWLYANLDLGAAVVLGTDLPTNPWTALVSLDALAF